MRFLKRAKKKDGWLSIAVLADGVAATSVKPVAEGMPSVRFAHFLPGKPDAAVLEKAGGAIRILQRDFTPDRLAVEIDALAADPDRLATMAARARGIGVLDAADRLADLVLKVARLTV